MACVEGLKGLPEALEAVWPHTQVPLWGVHKVRNSLRDGPWRERRAVAAARRAISGATTRADAEQALERFADRWDPKDPASSPGWRAAGDRLTVLFDSPPAMRRAIETTHAMESWNSSLRKVLKGRGAFPNDEAIVQLLYRGLQHVANKWTQPIPEWKAALNQCVMLFGERVQV
jgi:putative transposase